MTRLHLLLLAAATFAACSPDSGDTQGGDPIDGTGGTGVQEGGGGDASVTGGSSVGGEKSVDLTGLVGFLDLQVTRELWAIFSNRADDDACTRTKYGSCTVLHCSNGERAPSTYSSAGTVSYESPGLGVIQAEPLESGQYDRPTATFDPSFQGFLGGEEGVFRASGGDVPAFEQRLDFPILPLLDKPTGVDGKILVPRKKDLELQWSRGVDGMIISIRPEAVGTSFECRFEAAAGQGVVPASVLELVPAAGRLRIWAFATAQIDASSHRISLLSGSVVRTPDKAHLVQLTVE
jgi:hypothetical protein